MCIIVSVLERILKQSEIEPLCSGEGLADARAKGWQVQLARFAGFDQGLLFFQYDPE